MTAREAELARLCSLAEGNRRRLYEYVVSRSAPVTRDDASAALGLDRSLVAYHLDRLVDAGLLAVSFGRPPGRGGPGAGRPAKRYERAAGEVGVSVPSRDYQLAAALLARAVEDDASGRVRGALDVAASEVGRELGAEAAAAGRDLEGFLAGRGSEPYRDGAVVRLRNCPFRRIAQEHTEVVCGMNLALLTAAAEVVAPAVRARLDPAPGRCCVAFEGS